MLKAIPIPKCYYSFSVHFGLKASSVFAGAPSVFDIFINAETHV